MYLSNREAVVITAASIANTGIILNLGNDTIENAMTLRRLVPSLHKYQKASYLGNITVPYINIHSLRWILNTEAIPDDIVQAVTDPSSTILQISRSVNPLQVFVPGNAALLRDLPWSRQSKDDHSPHYDYPSATWYSGSKYVAILATRDHTQSTMPESSDVFGSLPATYHYLQTNYNNGFSNWYAVANVTFEAGVAFCSNCRSIASVLAQSLDYGYSDILPDPLVEEVFELMPEVMLQMATANASGASQINRLDDYTISLLARAYQGSWNALNDYVSNATETVTVAEPFQVLRASISKPRMYGWAAINLLLTVSGMILMITQAQCNRKPVIDTVSAAIMIDSSLVRSIDTTGLCNAVKLQTRDKSLGKLRLGPPPSSSSWAHDVLSPSITYSRQKTL